jgi:hypothetical protein
MAFHCKIDRVIRGDRDGTSRRRTAVTGFELSSDDRRSGTYRDLSDNTTTAAPSRPEKI